MADVAEALSRIAERIRVAKRTADGPHGLYALEVLENAARAEGHREGMERAARIADKKARDLTRDDCLSESVCVENIAAAIRGAAGETR